MKPTNDKAKGVIWKSAGQHLTHRLGNGWLAVSGDFLRAYYTRPEIHPVEEQSAQKISPASPILMPQKTMP